MRRPFQQNQTDPPRKQRLYFISFIFLKITTITSIKIRDFLFFFPAAVFSPPLNVQSTSFSPSFRDLHIIWQIPLLHELERKYASSFGQCWYQIVQVSDTSIRGLVDQTTDVNLHRPTLPPHTSTPPPPPLHLSATVSSLPENNRTDAHPAQGVRSISSRTEIFLYYPSLSD